MTRTTQKRLIALFIAVVMIACLLAPMVGPAAASCTYSMTNVKKLLSPSTAGWTGSGTPTLTTIGSLVIDLDPSTAVAANGQILYLSLPNTPSGFYLNVNPIKVTAAGGSSAVQTTVYNTNAYTLQLIFNNITPQNGATLYEIAVPLQMYVPSGFSPGKINLTLSAQGSSVYASGSVVAATVGADSMTIASEDTPTVGTTGGSLGVLDIKENAPGALYDPSGNNALTFTLPPGFSWDEAATLASLTYMWGDVKLVGNGTTADPYPGKLQVSLSNNDSELDIVSTYASNSGAYFRMAPVVTVDEATAATGDITITMGGSVGANASRIVDGAYGQYGATAAVKTAPTIVAGQTGVATGELEIKEASPGSLIAGRTITLTLPQDADWANYPSIDATLSTNPGTLGIQSEMVGTNGNTMQITVTGGPTTLLAADLFLQNFEVSTALGFSGPLTATVGGSEGLTGTVTVANVAVPITVTAASAPSISIGQASQALGNLTISEADAGSLSGVTYFSAIDTNSALETEGGDYGLCIDQSTNTEPNLYIVAPAGVTFDTTPTVTVSSGNLQLGTVTTETSDSYLDVNNEGVIVIPVQASSTTASTFTISGLAITVDNTVPEGPVVFKVEGPAVNQETDTNLSGQAVLISPETTTANLQAPFPNSTDAAQTTMGTVTNGVATGTAGTAGSAVFKIGQTSYTVDGAVYNIDVAPFINDSRAFLPLRYIANALGVPDSSIIYDPTTQKVTIIKDGTTVQLTIGSTNMLINGASVTMDVAPEIIDGRTCLPVSWVAQALSANIAWDPTAQTVTISF